jgi:uncharacterized protein (DUF302 family)
MTPREHDGIVAIPAAGSVDDVLARILAILEGKGITLFAIVDHAGEAKKAGLVMRPTRLIIFGSPKAGTPLMIAAPSIAIDLPLKLLVWEDTDGQVYLSYNTARFLLDRHHLPSEMLQVLSAPEGIAHLAATQSEP